MCERINLVSSLSARGADATLDENTTEQDINWGFQPPGDGLDHDVSVILSESFRRVLSVRNGKAVS